MKVELEIEDSKAEAFMEVIQNISFVKVKNIKPKKTKLVREFEAAIEELILIKQGKKQATDADEFLRSL